VDEVLAEALNGRWISKEPAQSVDEVDRPEWLHQIVRRARGHAFLAVRGAVARGQHDHRDVPGIWICLELPANVEARRPVHALLIERDVEQHRLGRIAPREVEGLIDGRRLRDGPARRRQRGPDRVADEPMIVGDENVSHSFLVAEGYVRRRALYSPRGANLNSIATTSYALPARGAPVRSNAAAGRASAESARTGLPTKGKSRQRSVAWVAQRKGAGWMRRLR